MKVKIRCICGRRHTVEVDGNKIPCPCGVELYAHTNDDKYITPWVTIPEDSLDERRLAGHEVLFQEPKAIRAWR